MEIAYPCGSCPVPTNPILGSMPTVAEFKLSYPDLHKRLELCFRGSSRNVIHNISILSS
jgi:hypothetical protein